MTIQLTKIHSELKYFFEPKSIAVIGASHHPEKVGYGVVKNLLFGGVFSLPHLKGFRGKIFAVNPKAKEILGMKSYAKIADIPAAIDLAIICIPAKLVPQAVKECVEKKVKGITIISAGFAELGKTGKKLQEQFLAIAKPAGIRIIGPN